jgi:hypothetical protein
MNVAAFALILLSAAYIFLRRWQLSRSHLMRSDGHALYFLVVAAAVPVGVWTASVLRAIGWILPNPAWGHSIGAYFLGDVLGDQQGANQVLHFGIIAVATLAASPVLAWLLNLPVVGCSALTARLLFRLGSVAELERFLWDANDRGLSVMVTTTTGKVYVGNSLYMPVPGHDKEFIRLEPLLSGYRDERQDFQPTTSYSWIASLPSEASSAVGELCKRDFDVVVPIDKVASVHSFDLATYVARYRSIVANTDGMQPEQGPRSQIREDPRVHTTKAEWFYLFYVVAVAVAPTLIACNMPFVAVATAVLGALCGFASAVESFETSEGIDGGIGEVGAA